jgi:hypothetical protein
MKHLRKFNENSNRPGPNSGSKSITISQDEVNSFSTEPSLQKLIADEKVSVIGDKVYYNDDETKSILDEYLEVAGKVEERVNLKGLAVGAMMALMTACHNGEVNGEASEGYTGDMLVKKIEMGGSKHNFFIVHGLDKEGKYIEFKTDQLTFNVGDSIHVDFQKKKLIR